MTTIASKGQQKKTSKEECLIQNYRRTAKRETNERMKKQKEKNQRHRTWETNKNKPKKANNVPEKMNERKARRELEKRKSNVIRIGHHIVATATADATREQKAGKKYQTVSERERIKTDSTQECQTRKFLQAEWQTANFWKCTHNITSKRPKTRKSQSKENETMKKINNEIK